MTAPYVRWGSVSESEWNRLKAAGWRGRAGDSMEALYAPPSRELQQVARRFADQQTQRLNEIPASPMFFGTVTNLSPLFVRWRGGVVPVVSYAASYTPGLNDWVLCSLVQNQVVVLGEMVPT